MPPSTAKAAGTAAPPKNLVELTVPIPDDSNTSTAKTALAYAENFQVSDAVSYQLAASAAAKAQIRWDEVEAQRVELKKPILEAGRKVDALFATPLTTLKNAKDILRGKLTAWDRRQQEIRAEQQRQADEAVRIERERLQREAAETERKAREKAEEERRQAEAARKAGDLAAAQKLEQRAERTEDRAVAKAANLQASAMSVVAPIIQAETPKVSGVARKLIWKFRIRDDSKLPREYTTPDEKKIAGVVRALKGDTRIEGVEVWSEPDVSVSKGAA